MSIATMNSYYGFTRTPLARNLAPSMLHRHQAHAEATARIGWCVAEQAIGVITGEVGAGKTVAVRAALAGLDQSRHTIIYLGNPATGTRGIYSGIVTALGGVPRFHKASLIRLTRGPTPNRGTKKPRQSQDRRGFKHPENHHHQQ